MNRNYLHYLLTSKKHLTIFLLIVGLLPTCFYLLTSGYEYVNSYSAFMIFSGIIALIESLVLPFIYFHFLNSKRALDTYYNLPIERKELVITGMVHMLLTIIITVFIGTIIPTIFSFGNFESLLGLMMFYVFLVVMIITTSLYVLAIMYKAYSTIDAIIITLAYLVLPAFVIMVFMVFSNNHVFALVDIFSGIYRYLMMPLTYIGVLSEALDMVLGYGFWIQGETIVLTVEMFLIAIACFFSIRSDIRKRKAEFSETNSSNIFAYPLVIATVTICMMLTVGFANIDAYWLLVLYILIFIAYLIMTFVYRRKIRFSKRDMILFAIALALSATITNISAATDSFGLNQFYRSVKKMEVSSFYVAISPVYCAGDCVNYIARDHDIFTVSDHDAIADFITFENTMYEHFRQPDKDYSGDYQVYVYYNIIYEDQRGLKYRIFDNMYIEDRQDLESIMRLLGLFDAVDLEREYCYENGECHTEQISYETLFDEISKDIR